MRANMNRRALMAGAAAVPVAALPALPAIASEPDPVFAAIERHRTAWLANARAQKATDHHEEEIDHDVDPRPFALVPWRNYSHIGGSEIEDRRDLFIRRGEPSAVINAEYQKVKAAYEAKCAKEKAWEDRNGLTPLNERAEATRAELNESISALVDTEPTTVAGVLALLAYVWDFNVGGLAITKDWYSNSALWPQTMSQDDVLDKWGRPMEMEFSHWMLRNVEQALRNITAAA